MDREGVVHFITLIMYTLVDTSGNQKKTINTYVPSQTTSSKLSTSWMLGAPALGQTLLGKLSIRDTPLAAYLGRQQGECDKKDQAFPLFAYLLLALLTWASHWRKQEMHVEVQIPCVCLNTSHSVFKFIQPPFDILKIFSMELCIDCIMQWSSVSVQLPIIQLFKHLWLLIRDRGEVCPGCQTDSRSGDSGT